MLKRVLAVFLLAFVVPLGYAQSVGILMYGAGAWSPAVSSSSSNPVGNVGQQIRAYCYNTGLGKWVPADSSCFGGGGSSGFPITIGSTSIAAGATTTAITGLTIDGVSPTTMGFVDFTSSGQTQLNAKAASNATLTLGSTTLTLGVTTTSVSGLTLVAPALGTPTALVLTNATGLPLTGLNTQAADTFLANATGGSASPTAVAFPTSGTNGCAGTTNALTYNTTTHAMGCNTLAAGSGDVTNITGSSQITATGCTQSASTGGHCTVSGSSTTAVTFSVIPGAYQSIQIKVYGQMVSANAVNIRATLNGDTGSNYASNGVFQSGSATPGPENTVSAAFCVAGALSQSLGSSALIELPGYADTSFQKTILSQSVAFNSISTVTNNIYQALGCEWSNTAAVTSITLTVASNDYAANTKFIVYGIN